ncbi:hypothetical protein [Gracilimonas sp.]|uniref:hypothetical protein n=1 Tax=Gracilimonas sp. TaxID=1974203 RepID=UPI0028724F76|nr:hypothetical protein [Gracilimonas sp.]
MFKKILFILLAGLAFQSCSTNDNSLVCTEEFVQITVEVTDASGDLAEGVEIQITEKETDTIVPCDEYLCEEFPDGSYIIMHDGFHGEISETGQTFIVKGTKGELGFEEEYTFRSGECHIEKVSGPETVTLSES